LIGTSINDDGSLWGVNRANQIFYCANYKNCGWQHVYGSLNQISARNGVVCGVQSGGAIYCSQHSGPTVSWSQLPGVLKDISVNSDGSLWGVNQANQI
jgi:hypothetical protein